MPFSVHFDGMSEWGAAVDELIAKADEASKEVVTKGVEIINKHAKVHAPVKSGNLRRGIARTKLARFTASSWMAETGPTAVYGRRIDLGFVGADSLGRVYDQAGNPFWETGVDESQAELEALYTDVYSAALGV